MTIMQSVTKIKYKGIYIPAYTPFEVDTDDVEKLVAEGCHILRQPKPKKIASVEKAKRKED